MSKLYDVISRLEDVASEKSESQDAPMPEMQARVDEKKSPWLRVLLFSIVIVALGGITIGATAWLQKWFVDNKNAITTTKPEVIQESVQAPAPPPPLETVKADPATPAPPVPEQERQAAPEMAAAPQPQEVPAAREVAAPSGITEQFTGEMSIDVATQDLTVETLDEFLASGIFDLPQFLENLSPRSATIFIHPLDIAEAVEDDTPEFVEPVRPEKSPPFNENKARASRWLHQAELYRHEGEWESAIILYKKVWQLTADPAVANNLAAALIQVNKPREALTILREGVIQAPDDPDIAQNLYLVEQLLEM